MRVIVSWVDVDIARHYFLVFTKILKQDLPRMQARAMRSHKTVMAINALDCIVFRWFEHQGHVITNADPAYLPGVGGLFDSHVLRSRGVEDQSR